MAGMKKPNDHAEPTKVERLKSPKNILLLCELTTCNSLTTPVKVKSPLCDCGNKTVEFPEHQTL